MDLDLNPLHRSVPAVEENESQRGSLLLTDRKGLGFVKCFVTPEPTTAAPGMCNAFRAESDPPNTLRHQERPTPSRARHGRDRSTTSVRREGVKIREGGDVLVHEACYTAR